jgi:hypothetical protein
MVADSLIDDCRNALIQDGLSLCIAGENIKSYRKIADNIA